MGIEQIKSVLSFPLSLHMAYDKANADGKIDVNDVGFLMDPIMKLLPAVQGAKAALEEYKDIEDAERSALNEWVKASYDIADDKLEEKIEAAFDTIFSVGILLGAFKKEEVEAPADGESAE